MISHFFGESLYEVVSIEQPFFEGLNDDILKVVKYFNFSGFESWKIAS